MSTNRFFVFFLNNPFYTKLLFVFTFILYGIIISSISFSISNHYQTLQTKSKVIETQRQSFKIKSTHLKNLMNDFSRKIKSLKKSEIFNNYLENRNYDSNANDLFSVMIDQTAQFSQLRYIDENGYERIRFDRNELGLDSYEVQKGKLQNKASRYYFKEIKALKNGDIWYSKLDLNVEYGKIQMPIVPTLRMGTPIFDKNGKFKGLIIINIFFKNIINDFVNSSFFYITIYDKDGEFIHHKHEHEENKMVDFSWSRYLKKDFNINTHKDNLKNLLDNSDTKDYIFNVSIKDIIPNGDELAIYYEPKILELKEIEKNEKSYITTVTFIVLAISIPLALIISVIPGILNQELYKTKKLLEKEAKIVDENVYLSITDIKGIILDVSTAYEDLTGYKKDELIGKKHSILRHSNSDDTLYKELWQTILSKNEWEGEIENLKKDGSSFYSKVLIKPNLDSKNEIETFTAYTQDVTYQKKIEKVSITDELTGLFNRREFNRTFKNSIAYSKRYGNPFSFIILDIDYFKQYNDTYGHDFGDIALKEVAKDITAIVKRDSDLSFRLGGEEFGIMFSSNTKEDAVDFSQKVRKSIHDLKIEHKNSEIDEYLTVSIGLFYVDKLNNLDEKEIYSLCDKALYQSKREGRNKVCIARL